VTSGAEVTPQALLARLDAIGTALALRGDALALIGLGSVGNDTARLDAYSDLDFFVIVAPGAKRRYLDDLSWLSASCPIDFHFQNTVDGCKALYADGIFCEFAVFEPQELDAIPFAPGRIVWKRVEVDASIAQPRRPLPPPDASGEQWLLGEALTNLFVGLARNGRGETLAALRLIQVFAVDRVLELASRREVARGEPRDPFAPERRIEQRLPQLARELPAFMRGYGENVSAALAILAYLERNFAVNSRLAAAIRRLAQR